MDGSLDVYPLHYVKLNIYGNIEKKNHFLFFSFKIDWNFPLWTLQHVGCSAFIGPKKNYEYDMPKLK